MQGRAASIGIIIHDPLAGLGPRDGADLPVVKLVEASPKLLAPGGISVVINRWIEALNQAGGQFGTLGFGQSQGFIEQE